MTSVTTFHKLPDPTNEFLVGGQEIRLNPFKFTFTAAMVGNAPGQTQHAAGCPILEIDGGSVKSVLGLEFYKVDAGSHFKVGATIGDHFSRLALVYSPDGRTVCLKDNGDDVSTRVEENDYVQGIVLIGARGR